MVKVDGETHTISLNLDKEFLERIPAYHGD
jgi:hypothetical protein